MKDVGVNKQGYHQRPDSAVFKIAQTEDEISFGKRWVLLPCPNAGCDAGEDQQRVDLQVIDKREGATVRVTHSGKSEGHSRDR